MRSWLCLVVFGVACAGVALAAAHLVADDAKKLEATWVVESTSRDKELAAPWQGGEFVFGGGKVTVKLPRSKEQTFPFTVDAAKEPKTMDFAAPKTEAPWLMIYELDGDSLKLCIERDKRPTEFSNKQGLVVILKRKK
jgi:uncharacterized protein (TIGR03067 family)